MIEITSLNGWYNTSFHFRTMEDCEKFMYGFKNHMCNIRWTDPKEIPDNTPIKDARYLDVPIEKRVWRSLDWGFASDDARKLTNRQAEFVNDLVNTL